jgi:hypothetical protein
LHPVFPRRPFWLEFILPNGIGRFCVFHRCEIPPGIVVA